MLRNSKKTAIPELKETAKDAFALHEEAKAAEQQEERIADLKKELAWSFVSEAEHELSAKAFEVVQSEKVVAKSRHRVEQAIVRSIFFSSCHSLMPDSSCGLFAQASLAAANAEVERLEAGLENIGDPDEMNREREVIKELIKAKREAMLQITVSHVTSESKVCAKSHHLRRSKKRR